MKTMRMLLLVAVVLAFSQAALAQCPNAIGQWSTTNGTMIGGRATEAWCGAGGFPVQGGVPGNTQNAMSWDGVTLGGQWRAWGMSIDGNGATLVSEVTLPNGNVVRTYSTDYVDGEFWLTGNNTWSDGVADLTGDLTYFNVITTITYLGGTTFAGASSNITFTGTFANCPGANGCEIRFGITNALLVWNPAFGGSMPANYPALLCGAGLGEAFDVCCITIDIFCAVDAEDWSWGSVKALYK
jgi:hypothetical protein